jgi:transposase
VRPGIRKPIDMRWSFDRLAGAALERIGYDARRCALFIYFGKRRDAVKVLFLCAQVDGHPHAE